MQTLPIFQVDAFAEERFSGNPAAVVPLNNWLPDELMQKIAMENNLSETAFFIPDGDNFALRWFTPTAEVRLCGHATLATAHVIFNHLDYRKEEIHFQSRQSGILRVMKDGDLLVLDFPADAMTETSMPAGLQEAMNAIPTEVYKGLTDYMCVFPSQEIIESLNINIPLLAKLPVRGLICTAPGKGVDFVSRFFAPAVGVDEDPVTGSAHTSLIPYWSKRLGKQAMHAIQLSKRKGVLRCKMAGDRVHIAGRALTYLEGSIFI
ncbi:MAG: PhzF family phenazine biosynthesis protein [Bacteroidota bacterium]